MRHDIGRYTIITKMLEADPSEDEQWYWHLFRSGIRINGGISDSEEHALFEAGRNRMKDAGDWPVMQRSERV